MPPGLTVLLSSSATVQPQVVETPSIARSALPKLRIVNSLLQRLVRQAVAEVEGGGLDGDARAPAGAGGRLAPGRRASDVAQRARTTRATVLHSDLPAGAPRAFLRAVSLRM